MTAGPRRAAPLLRLLGLMTAYFAHAQAYANTPPPSCSHRIYCQGDLLDTVQMAGIYSDSKTFVDMKLTQPVDTTLEDFKNLMSRTNDKPSRSAIEGFVIEHFAEGDELEVWTPPDHKESPAFIDDITDESLKQFAKELVRIWPTLGRKAVNDVKENPDLYSFIYLPNGFIIPGGRFKEIYYWDSFWIVKGLLISEMTETVKGVLENFLYLVKKIGHIPNGSRVYYSQRSQPPLLTAMVKEYIDKTDDWKWLKKNIATLDKELDFWLENRSVTVTLDEVDYILLRYHAESAGPRPESYLEDINAAQLIDEDDRQRFFTDLKSAAESGWDFSSRWFMKEGGCEQGCNLTDVRTSSIIPVDLNAIYANACKILAKFYYKLGDSRNSKKWNLMAIRFVDAIEKILWDDEHGIWYDYDLNLHKPRRQFFPSNVFPLWLKTIPRENLLPEYAERVLDQLNDSGALEYPGGIPASLLETGQQWDSPNAWAPLQAIIIVALRESGFEQAKATATELAQKWVRANQLGFESHEAMFEKYDAKVPGKHGGGGEYVVQAGFGWTNGVALQLLSEYGKVITSNKGTGQLRS